MKESRIIPCRKKQISFTANFFVLHLYLAYISHVTLGASFIDAPGEVTIDGADFTVLAVLLGGLVESIIFYINLFVTVLVLAVLFTIYMLIFNKLFYLSLADDGERFQKYANCIMLALMFVGFFVLNILNFKLFPLSLISTLLLYLSFSFLAYLITMRKIKKTYL